MIPFVLVALVASVAFAQHSSSGSSSTASTPESGSQACPDDLPPRWKRACEEAQKRKQNEPPPSEQDLRDEALVRARAQARWTAIAERRFDDAYEFLSPASRLVVSREQHAWGYARLAYRDIELEKVVCRNGSCRVSVFVTTDMEIPRVGKTPLRTIVTEPWDVQDGTAWLRAQ
ncbi:MAG: hypothetical protein NZ533_12260 [Casimicrobiaceae bacterium]|nr:hypothetical protein [Casimicrobiaceae bacterium]